MSRSVPTPEAVRALRRDRVHAEVALAGRGLSHAEIEAKLPHITPLHIRLAVAELAAAGRIRGFTEVRRCDTTGIVYQVRVYLPDAACEGEVDP